MGRLRSVSKASSSLARPDKIQLQELHVDPASALLLNDWDASFKMYDPLLLKITALPFCMMRLTEANGSSVTCKMIEFTTLEPTPLNFTFSRPSSPSSRRDVLHSSPLGLPSTISSFGSMFLGSTDSAAKIGQWSCPAHSPDASSSALPRYRRPRSALLLNAAPPPVNPPELAKTSARPNAWRRNVFFNQTHRQFVPF